MVRSNKHSAWLVSRTNSQPSKKLQRIGLLLLKSKKARLSQHLWFLASHRLPIISSISILGVIFTNDLNWREHTESIRKSIAAKTSVNLLLQSNSKRGLQKILLIFVVPKQRYCIFVWWNFQPGFYTAMNSTFFNTICVIINKLLATTFNKPALIFTGKSNFTNHVMFCHTWRTFARVQSKIL